jgi:dUTP pyrophosphatase
MVELALRRLHARAVWPQRMTSEAAGLDLCACLGVGETLSLAPGRRVCVPTGWALAIPRGYEGQVRPRSGLALRAGVTVLNAPGTIDADYRGELSVLLVNFGDETFAIAHGDRIAQLVIAPVVAVPMVEVSVLPDSDRGTGGFGSTG